MGIQPYLAMTAAEIRNVSELPPRLCWMACHFSLYGRGLSNIPQALPKGAMLMLDDSIPISDHDPELVVGQLRKLVEKWGCDGVLLDFQRKNVPRAHEIGRAVAAALPCPVGISAYYAENLDCAVLLPPIPPHVQPADCLAPWQGREAWLELGREASQMTVTSDHCQWDIRYPFAEEEPCHMDRELFCHYNIKVEADRIRFRLWRTREDVAQLLTAAEQWGVTRGLGLYQELRQYLTGND